MEWSVAMHNHVNSSNGKKIYSVKDAIKAIIENDDKCLISDENKEPIIENNNFDNTKIEKFKNKEKFSNDKETIILSISICINILLILFLFIKNKYIII
jgi:hypothetical protein